MNNQQSIEKYFAQNIQSNKLVLVHSTMNAAKARILWAQKLAIDRLLGFWRNRVL